MSRHANGQPERYGSLSKAAESMESTEPRFLSQLHHQSISNPRETRFIAQKEIRPSEVNEWLRDVNSRHPLPEGWQWMICDEKYEGFARGPA